MSDISYDDNRYVMLLRRLRLLKVDYENRHDGYAIVIYCSAYHLSQNNIVQTLEDEKSVFI